MSAGSWPRKRRQGQPHSCSKREPEEVFREAAGEDGFCRSPSQLPASTNVPAVAPNRARAIRWLQNVLEAKRGLKAGGGEAGVQKAGRKAGKVIAVPIRGRGKGRGGAGRGGGSGRGATNGTAQPSLHPASLKITIRNDRVRLRV